MGIHDREYYRDDEPRIGIDLSARSMVTNLVIINAGVFLANMFTNDNALMDLLRDNPQYVGEPWNWWRWLTAGFAHNPADIKHLLFNMAVLWFLGRHVEQRLGSREFLAFYLASIVLANLAHDLRYFFFVDPSLWVPSLGASGGVTAVVILFALFFPFRQLLLFFIVPVPAWALAVLILLFDMFGMRRGDDNIAHDVHLAGAAFGAVYFLLYSRLQMRLTSWLPRGGWKRLLKRRPKLRIHHPDAPSDLEAEGDRLLDKVHRQGEESLTPRERKRLEEYSRYVRRKRQ